MILSACGIYKAQSQEAYVSGYYNYTETLNANGSPRSEWTEIIVKDDNVNMLNWSLRDNNTAQDGWQTAVKFTNAAFWNNLRAGTIIIIWHRQVDSTGTNHPTDVGKSDGYLELFANDPLYFTSGSFGTAPLWAGNSLNISKDGDILQLRNSADVHVHAIGHKISPGASMTTLLNTTPAIPVLNHTELLQSKEAVFVCPGGNQSDYGMPPQSGTGKTAKTVLPNITFGLPNTCANGVNSNSDYWRDLRQPQWVNPALTCMINTGNTQITLNWNASTDPFPADGTQGYMVLRNTADVFSPQDGYTYSENETLPGGGKVIRISSTQDPTTFTDNISVPCPGGFYYRVYAFRYSADNTHGNNYDKARGRAYNETSYAYCHATAPMPAAPVSASSDRNNFCADDPGNITLTAIGGSGATLNWFSDVCGGTLTGTGNSITIPSPSATTTYFARWENSCGSSSCVNVTVTVLPGLPVSVSVAAVPGNTVCTGQSVTFTATPVNGGSTPFYQWKKNGINTGSNSTVYTDAALVNGDQIRVEMTSSLSCASPSVASSNAIFMTVTPTVTPGVSIAVFPGNTICAGQPVTFTATPVNEGPAPFYQWKKNGINAGANSAIYTDAALANGDQILVEMTSSSSCASPSGASSNAIFMTVTPTVTPGVSIAAFPGNTICAGQSVTFTATPTNEGAIPVYQWYRNSVPAGTNSPSYNCAPADGDQVYVMMTSSLTCASGGPATSLLITMTVNKTMPVSLTIVASENPICAGTSVIFTATPVNGGSSPAFQWALNGTNAGSNSPVWSHAPANGDTISCVVTSNKLCASGNPATSDTIVMATSSALLAEVAISPDHAEICPGTIVTFTADAVNEGSSPVYEWLVEGLQVQQGNSPVYITNALAPGQPVSCALTSSLSCVAQKTVLSLPMSLYPATPPTVILTDKDYLCTGSNLTLDAGSPFTSYTWNDLSSGRYKDITAEGLYWVIVTDSLGCMASDTVLVKACSGNVFVPNAFSPNGDGRNDIFSVSASPDDISDVTIQVYSRWGDKVFESNNSLAGWDGIKQGVICPADSYVWIITYKAKSGSSSGKAVTLRGTVELVR